MLKACPRCGKIHQYNYVCNVNRYTGGKERAQRSTYAWRKKAEEIKKKAGYLCEVCKKNNVYTYEGLEIHHIVKLRYAPEKLLDNLNLSCLCTYHHKQADKGEISKEYLEQLARDREGI